MKKLMIAAAIVCAAALSQAATFEWANSTMYGPATANLTVPGTYAPSASPVDSVYAQTMQKSIVWTAAMSLDTSLGTDSLEFTPTVGYGTFGNKNLSSAVVANGTDAEPVTGTATVILTGTYTIDDTEYTITSNPIVSDVASFKELTTLQFTSGAATSWTISTSAVPEPTSGLLLLLGVAGLALKRKRA